MLSVHRTMCSTKMSSRTFSNETDFFCSENSSRCEGHILHSKQICCFLEIKVVVSRSLPTRTRLTEKSCYKEIQRITSFPETPQVLSQPLHLPKAHRHQYKTVPLNHFHISNFQTWILDNNPSSLSFISPISPSLNEMCYVLSLLRPECSLLAWVSLYQMVTLRSKNVRKNELERNPRNNNTDILKGFGRMQSGGHGTSSSLKNNFMMPR